MLFLHFGKREITLLECSQRKRSQITDEGGLLDGVEIYNAGKRGILQKI